jgi:hypothetical protein
MENILATAVEQQHFILRMQESSLLSLDTIEHICQTLSADLEVWNAVRLWISDGLVTPTFVRSGYSPQRLCSLGFHPAAAFLGMVELGRDPAALLWLDEEMANHSS